MERNQDEKETGEVHGRWGVIPGNAGTDAGEDERQVWKLEITGKSPTATALTSPHSSNLQHLLNLLSRAAMGKGDRCDWPAQQELKEGGKTTLAAASCR